MPRIPLAVNIGSRDATLEKDALLKNCFIEKTDNGLAVVKRPGQTLNGSLGAGCAQGGVTFNGEALFVQNNALKSNFQPTASGVTWTTATTPTKPSASQSFDGTSKAGYMLSFGGNLYHIGGRDTADSNFGVYKSTDNGTSWTTVLSAGSAPWTTQLYQHQMCATFGDYMLIFLKTGAAGSTGDWEVWRSSDGASWAKIVTALTGATNYGYGHGVVVASGIIYIVLSNNTLANGAVFYSVDGISWTAATTSAGWNNRKDASVFALNGDLYIAGGISGAGTYLNSVWKSTNSGATWTEITAAAAFTARSAAAAWTYDDMLFIGGGETAAGVRTNNIYSSEDGITWALVTAAAGWSARKYMSYSLHNGTMYIGPGYNSTTVTGLYYAALGSATSTALTSLTQGCLPIDIALIPAAGVDPAKIFLKSIVDSWVWDGTTLTKISDSDYPATTVRGVAYIDGTIYVMDSKGVIYGSDLAAYTAWSALNFISANQEADAGIMIARQLNNIIAFKDYSTEVFYNAGNPTGSSLSKVGNALLEIGLADPGSVAYTDNTIYFMSQSRQKGRSIMRMNGYTPEPVSTPAIERILNADDLETVYSFIVKLEGHLFYVITLETSDITLAFDASAGAWSQWTTLQAESAATVTSLTVQSDGTILAVMPLAHGISDGDPVTIAGASDSNCNGRFNAIYDTDTHSTLQFSYEPSSSVSGSITGSITAVFYTESSFRGAYYARGLDVDLILDKSNGKVYEFDPEVFDDNDIPINCEIRTQPVDSETIANKTISRLAIIGDRDDTNIVVNWSDDDYQTWSVGSSINIDDERPEIRRTGRFRRRAFKLRHVEDSRLRLVGLEPILKAR